MLSLKDFIVGCITVVLFAIFFPILWIGFKLGLIISIPIAILAALIMGVTVLGRIIRLLFSRKKIQSR